MLCADAAVSATVVRVLPRAKVGLANMGADGSHVTAPSLLPFPPSLLNLLLSSLSPLLPLFTTHRELFHDLS